MSFWFDSVWIVVMILLVVRWWVCLFVVGLCGDRLSGLLKWMVMCFLSVGIFVLIGIILFVLMSLMGIIGVLVWSVRKVIFV